MAHNHNHSSEIPEELIRHHSDEWQRFTRFTVIGCVAVAISLLLGLLLIKI